MSSKKNEKLNKKKDNPAMNEIKKTEKSLKLLSTNINKLKTIFKAKPNSQKK